MTTRHVSASILAAAGALLCLGSRPAAAAVVPFFNNPGGYTLLAGPPTGVMTFDGLPAGANITGATLPVGPTMVNFSTPSAPLLVVNAATTFSTPGFAPAGGPGNRLFATSGWNVLSPGGSPLVPGPFPIRENDDLVLTFNPPVRAAGLDVLYQSLDGLSLTSIRVLSSTGAVLYANPMIPIPGLVAGAAGGRSFAGVVSTWPSPPIARIIIDEYDANAANPDSNIGFDTLRIRQ